MSIRAMNMRWKNTSSHLKPCHIRVIFLVLGSFALSACTQEPPSQIPVGSSKPAYTFDASKTVALTIAKSDPATGDHWIATLERRPEKAGTFHESDPWVIRSYSENAFLQDHLANRNFILHLLDTLTTYHATELVKEGKSTASTEVRGSYGLVPPRYALRWQVWDPATQTQHEYSVEIGALTNPNHPTSKESFGSFPPEARIFKVDGAAIAMLDYLKNFSTLRQETLSTFTADAVDEIEIRQTKKTVFYAQREGDRWTNEKHIAWKKDVPGFLERMTHLRVQRFVDNPTEAEVLRKQLDQKELAQITFKDRFQNAQIFRLFKRKRTGTSPEAEYAQVSTRENSVFELYPGALTSLRP